MQQSSFGSYRNSKAGLEYIDLCKFNGTYTINQILLPQLSKNSGSIVHVEVFTAPLLSHLLLLATCKSALAGLTRAMAVDVGSMVRVNAIEPAADNMFIEGFADNPALFDQLKTITLRILGVHQTSQVPSYFCLILKILLNGCILSLEAVFMAVFTIQFELNLC